MGFMISKVSPMITKKTETFDLQIIKEHESGINTLAMNEEGTVIATAGDDNSVKLFSVSDDIESECLATLDGHTNYANCLTFDDIYVISGSADKTIRKWDITTFKCVLIFTSHKSVINRLIISGDYLFSSSYDSTAIRWNFHTGECMTVYRGHKLGVYPMAFVPYNINSSREHYDNDDDYSDDNRKNTYRVYDEKKMDPQDEIVKYKGDILITGSSDHTAIMWRVKSGKILHQLNGHTGGVTCMSLDENASNVFTGSMDKTIRCWSIEKGEMTRLFEGHTNSVICLIVKGKLMFSGSSDRTGRSWIIEFGDNARTFQGHGHTVTCIKYSDGTVFTGCGDGIIRCFDAKAGTLKRTLSGHSLAVNAILVVIGEKLYSGSNDGTLRIWDVSNMEDETAFASENKRKPVKMAKDKNQNLNKNSNKINNKNVTANKIVVEDDF